MLDHREYVLEHIKDISNLLEFTYKNPRHNNKDDPIDELIFIMLSRKTRGESYETVYNTLKRRYPDWADVALLEEKKLQSIIDPAGLGRKRARAIKSNLKIIRDRFGEYSLDRLRKWGNPKVFDFLTSLDDVGPKSAYCIMMYSLSRKVFPVDTHVNRICQRLGLIYIGTNHKEAQALLADVFPEKLRKKLHVNMLQHGRVVCRPRKPRCGECLLAGFCRLNREELKSGDGPGVIDLFAGPGGMSLGFEGAGFDLTCVIEAEKHACASFYHNHPRLPPERILREPVQGVSPRRFVGKGVKVLVAGIPCQEFSNARKNSKRSLGRKELYREVLRFAGVIRPRFVVIENVPGLHTKRNMDYVHRIEEGLRELGYVVRTELLNAKHFGIPQSRHRVFFIARRILRGSPGAARRSLNRVWARIHSTTNENEEDFETFRKAVSGLPRLAPGKGTDLMRGNRVGRRSRYATVLSDTGGLVYNHIARKHNPRDLEAYRIMEEGENALDLYRKRPDLMPYSTHCFATKYYKIRADAPSPTIVSHLKKDANSFINPFDNRGITPREAARIQSFPDSYRFLGSFGIQFEQIGNAVPPILAEVIGRAIIEEMGVIGRNRKVEGEYQ